MGALGTGVAGTAWLDEAVVAQSLLRRPRIAVKADANDAGPIDKGEGEFWGAGIWLGGRPAFAQMQRDASTMPILRNP